ncbi:MAG: hypothetical protein AAB250_14605 [Bdellovibrionota bacterium]
MEMIENKKLEALLNAVFTAENQKGHLKWKVSELARACKVSKSLVYYHLGKSKVEILYSCIDIVGAEFYGLNPTRENMVRSGDLISSIEYTRKMFMQTPAFTGFYVRWRMTQTDVGKRLENLDNRYQAKLAALFPKLNAVEREGLQAIFHGLVTSPKLDRTSMIAVLKWLPLG